MKYGATMLKRSQAGFTLAELLISSLLMSVVAIGIYSIDVSRLRIQNDLRRAAGATSDELLTELAVMDIQKSLEQADRVVMLDTNADGTWDVIQVRTTTGTGANLSDPSDLNNYRWDQYSLVGGDLLYFKNIPPAGACPQSVVMARQITGLTFNFRNEAIKAPPGGEPFITGDDNNVVSYTVSWNDGTRSHGFAGEVTLRGAPYSNLNAAVGDSGEGTAGALPAVPIPC